ncbi:Rne/Rng family ribonuclease [Peribacillus deserti]|uniref:Ribonuclease E/G n=1 Tax=Peribacillus deserti TaxID=673318 RepID=A0A2N5M706_9BACI|nr:Rne/Rng family ribonuclease [Peribacillus deserti]PLT30137.1 ribonuclease E/G [Peribacillus deserti]
MKKIIVNAKGREKRFAMIENNTVTKLEVHQPGHESIAGNIYWGTVTKVLPGMDAAFVDIGGAKQGFLHRDQLPSYQLSEMDVKKKKSLPIGHFIRQGEKLIVQAVRDPEGAKGPKLTGIIEMTSDKMVAMFGTNYIGVSKKMSSLETQKYWRERAFSKKKPGEGFIIRTTMEKASEDEFDAGLEEVRKRWESVLSRASSINKPGLLLKMDKFREAVLSQAAQLDAVIIDDFSFYQDIRKELTDQAVEVHFERGAENIFSIFHIETEASSVFKQNVMLTDGIYLVIEETEACTVIDVNTGSFTGKSEKEATLTQANIIAAKEAARQLRLRNIGGIIVIDFMNMQEEHNKRKVVQALKEALAADEMPTHIAGFTGLGMLQLTRKKTSPSIHEKLMVPCPVCSGSGSIESAETLAFRLERELLEARGNDSEAVWIEAAVNVIEALAGSKNEHLEFVEGLAAKKLIFTKQDTSIPHYHIRHMGSLEEIQVRIKGEHNV